MAEPKRRDPLKDYLKAVNDQIADREAAGVGPTPYLLEQKADLEAVLGVAKKEAPVEHKAVEQLPEHAVPESPQAPRRPGRPKKDVDDAAAGS